MREAGTTDAANGVPLDKLREAGAGLVVLLVEKSRPDRGGSDQGPGGNQADDRAGVK